ncbi:MAG TPA: ATP-binding protein [Nocardioides sp.]|uniref:ATP-binding protein n=1 Tax=Nocardioides sp. TaxID=35761 RepID=UPI002BD48D60|nr:ATP-binding protein [Nocardioides sp.]HQR28155.1 ATP-binding protein [Nocardioides sp.]
MPTSHFALTLDTDPRSVQEARRWVASACQQIGRTDLQECAELGVSELVTNALLHAADPIVVRVRGTSQHPRVEVADGSQQPPVLLVPEPSHEFDDLLATFGRGLSIVARCSVAWGAAMEQDGKVVWFEPATAPSHDGFIEGSVFHLDDLPSPRVPDDPAELAPVALQDVPVGSVLGLRRHYRELRREVHLLSLAHEADYPLAKNLAEIFHRFDVVYPPEVRAQLNEAIEAGNDTVDFHVTMHRDVAVTVEQMLALLDLADEFCRGQRLLTLARSPEQAEFQRWFLGEFVRQSRGEPPLPWHRVNGTPLSR